MRSCAVIEFPPEWVQHPGAEVTTALPAGLGARFRYFERLRPVQGFAAIVERMLATDPDFVARDVGQVLRVVTHEGEYGAWCAIDGRRQGARARRCIGAAFLDDFVAVLDVIALIPEHFTRVEQLSLQLTREQSFRLSQRARRFFYTPPAGWQGFASGASVTWMPMDFPANLTSIVVPSAERVGEHVGNDAIEATCARLGAGLSISTEMRQPLTAASGHAGIHARITGTRSGRSEPIHRELAMFVVAQQGYAFRLETTNTTQLLALSTLLRDTACSFQPLPTLDEKRQGTAFVGPTDVFAHWMQ